MLAAQRQAGLSGPPAQLCWLVAGRVPLARLTVPLTPTRKGQVLRVFPSEDTSHG